MGLFWADSTRDNKQAIAAPATNSSGGWFWSNNSSSPKALVCPHKPKVPEAGVCPVQHSKPKVPEVGVCPVQHSKPKADKASECPVKHSPVKSGSASECPVLHSSSDAGNNSFGHINPLNNMPASIPDQKQAWQKLDLPTERTSSSIPKGDGTAWEYPSPQQMYNAMIRKGKIDPNTGEEIPEDAVESMVFVHNFLNEGCWQEVLQWEKKYTVEETPTKLLRFMGRPDDLSPRARIFHYLSFVFPSHFYQTLPFDRHDWYVLRPDPSGSSSSQNGHPGYKEVRYVIDFYEGPDDEEGMPTFNLDVRPALDSLESCKDRLVHWGKPIMEQVLDEKKK